jgi:DNA-binding CsgD family transcriptional regulator
MVFVGGGLDPTDFLSVVGMLYDAAVDPSQWQAVTEALARTFAAPSGLLQFHEPNPVGTQVLGFTTNLTEERTREYVEHYYAHDPWSNKGIREAGIGNPMLGTEVMAEAELLNSEFYVDWLRPCGTFDIVGGTYPLATGGLALIGVHRPIDAPRFDKMNKKWMGVFLRHFAQAIDLQNRLRSVRSQLATTMEALNAVDAGVLIVDSNCRVLFANAYAEAQLRDGRGISVRNGCLHTVDPIHIRQIQKRVQDAVRMMTGRFADAGAPVALPRADAGPLMLLVCPLSQRLSQLPSGRPAAMVFISSSESRRVLPEQVLMGIYGLSGAEARLAVALLHGKSLQEACDQFRITANTARTQLKSIFSKTGFNGQSDLIRQLSGNMVLRMARKSP